MEEVEPRLAEYEMQFKIKALELLHSLSPTPSSLRVLDFGCGRGEFLRMLAEAGFQGTGVDFDQNCVNLSSRWGPCFRADDATVTQVLAGKQFDVITAIHVLEHLENPKQAVEELKKLCPKWMVLAVPNLAIPVGLSRKEIKRHNPGHYYGWDAGHFETFLQNKCGLHIERWISDTVVLPKISRMADRLRCRRWLEYTFLPKRFPFLSTSLIVLCRV